MPGPEWANKPNAVIHAELLDRNNPQFTPEEIHQFYKGNPMPRWALHPEVPPHPSRSQLEGYIADPEYPILIAVDQDRELWGVRINKSDGTGDLLWINLRREDDKLHEDLGTRKNGGLTKNSRQTLAHFSALTWALIGKRRYGNPDESENKNFKQLPFNQLQQAAEKLFVEQYAPFFGINPDEA